MYQAFISVLLFSPVIFSKCGDDIEEAVYPSVSLLMISALEMTCLMISFECVQSYVESDKSPI